MTLFLTALAVIAIDRMIPVSGWLFGITSYKTSLKEVLRGYKLISFPRTLLAVCVCVPHAVASFIQIDHDILNMVVIVLYFIFAAVAMFDASRAIRSGGYREGAMRPSRSHSERFTRRHK